MYKLYMFHLLPGVLHTFQVVSRIFFHHDELELENDSHLRCIPTFATLVFWSEGTVDFLVDFLDPCPPGI